MKASTAESNKAHEEALKVVENYLAASPKNKIITELKAKGKAVKGAINRPTPEKHNKTKSFANAEKLLLSALKKFGKLTSNELVRITGYEKSTLFNVAKSLEKNKRIKRIKGKTPTELTGFKLA
jgi:uncharacterized membrane protein